MHPVHSTEVANIILALKKDSMTSDIPVKILKLICEPLAIILAELFNYSISQNKFPQILQLTRITLKFKKGDRGNVENYRPISNLNPIAKIFDKILHKRLYNYLTEFELLSPQQYGFRFNRGTEHAVSNFMYQVNKSNQNGETLIACYVDLRKAFDSICHDVLLNKLSAYGIRGSALKFFQTYLSNRRHYTVMAVIRLTL